MEKPLQFFNNISPLSSALEDHLKNILKRNSFNKHTYLLKAGQVSNCIHYLESGLVRCFYDNGAQVENIWFMPAGNVVISVESFSYQVKSNQYIQALEDCITWSITYQELQYILGEFPEFLMHKSSILEKYLVENERRERIILRHSVVDRYTEFIMYHPEIIHQLPAKYIASYLNVDESYFN